MRHKELFDEKDKEACLNVRLCLLPDRCCVRAMVTVTVTVTVTACSTHARSPCRCTCKDVFRSGCEAVPAVAQDLLDFLRRRPGQCGIIYARQRETCDTLARSLRCSHRLLNRPVLNCRFHASM